VRVSLTPRSRALAARMAPQIEAVYQGIEQVLGAGEVEQLAQRLDSTIAQLGPGYADPADDPAD
jgi:DNA-binding MarR family transcriptional regulator